ncbi:hypothetical protein HDV05_003178, partial [Chytridiales sp. JEL 0842]
RQNLSLKDKLSFKYIYTPVYDYSDYTPVSTSQTSQSGLSNIADEPFQPSKDNKKPRYCGGKVSRGCFVCWHIVIIVILLNIIIVPIVLWVVVPNIIRDK